MATYSVGSWHGIAAKTAIALLPPNVPLAAVEQIWHDLHENKGLAALLDGLGEVFGTSLKALPEFAIVSALAEDSLSVAVRGPIEARISAADGSDPLVVTGVSVTTWTEQVLSGVTAVELSAPAATNHDLRPVRDGVVPADRISMTIGEPLPDRSPANAAGRAASPEPLINVPESRSRIAAAQPTLESVPEVLAEGWPPASRPMVAEPAAVRSDPEATVSPEEAPEFQGEMLGETMLASAVEVAARRPSESTGDAPVLGSANPTRSQPPPTAAGQPGPSPGSAPGSSVGQVSGDHDYLTLAADQIRELRAAGMERAPSPKPGSRPPVQLVVPNAANVTLDRTTIIGRRPQLNRVPGGRVPQLVTVPSPGGGVSGNHVELRIEGVSVLAVDLDSTNGTRLLRRGRQPVRLAPGEETLLVPGDQLDLGEGVLLSFEGLV